jgi:hypothetical protein
VRACIASTFGTSAGSTVEPAEEEEAADEAAVGPKLLMVACLFALAASSSGWSVGGRFVLPPGSKKRLACCARSTLVCAVFASSSKVSLLKPLAPRRVQMSFSASLPRFFNFSGDIPRRRVSNAATVSTSASVSQPAPPQTLMFTQKMQPPAGQCLATVSSGSTFLLLHVKYSAFGWLARFAAALGPSIAALRDSSCPQSVSAVAIMIVGGFPRKPTKT